MNSTIPLNWRQIAGQVVAYKLFLLWLVLIAAKLVPGMFSTPAYTANFHWPEAKAPGLEERFKTWDSQHYIYLSNHGYKAGSPSTAFFPLWPGLISAADKALPGATLLPAIVLANLFSVGAFLLFYLLVRKEFGDEIALTATAFLVVFPGSLFYHLPYSESLFLFLALLLFWALKSDRRDIAMACALLLPMTRPVGFLCLLPVVTFIWENKKPWKDYFVYGAFFLGGLATYFMIMYMFTRNFTEGLNAQNYYLAGASLGKLLHPVEFLGSFLKGVKLGGILDSIFDRIFFVIFLMTLPLVYRMNKTWFVFSLMMGLIPAVTNSFVSYTRYVAVVFPLFVVAGQYFATPEMKPWRGLALAASLGLQLLFILLHSNNYWFG